jgi:hypothetical protein
MLRLVIVVEAGEVETFFKDISKATHATATTTALAEWAGEGLMFMRLVLRRGFEVLKSRGWEI